MGPKPFSVGSGDVNFDKVFSVPQAPGNERITNTVTSSEIISDNQNKSTESSDNSIDEQKDSDEKEGNLADFFYNLVFFIICLFFIIINSN